MTKRVEYSLTWATPLLSVLNLVVLLGGGVWWGSAMHHRIAENNRGDERHHGDVSLHMPFEKKVETFLTRREYEKQVALRDRQYYELKKSLAEDMGFLRSEIKEADKKLEKLLEDRQLNQD